MNQPPYTIRESKSTQTPNGWVPHEAWGLASENAGLVGATDRPGFTWETNAVKLNGLAQKGH